MPIRESQARFNQVEFRSSPSLCAQQHPTPIMLLRRDVLRRPALSLWACCRRRPLGFAPPPTLPGACAALRTCDTAKIMVAISSALSWLASRFSSSQPTMSSTSDSRSFSFNRSAARASCRTPRRRAPKFAGLASWRRPGLCTHRRRWLCASRPRQGHRFDPSGRVLL